MSGGVAAYMLWLNRLFYGFLTFDMDKLGIIRRHQWKERLKTSKAAKFESDLLKLNENIAPQSREILQTFTQKQRKRKIKLKRTKFNHNIIVIQVNIHT